MSGTSALAMSLSTSFEDAALSFAVASFVVGRSFRITP